MGWLETTMPFTKDARASTNLMPKPETIRKYYPKTTLSDMELSKLAEWSRDYLGLNHISPENKVLGALIAMEEGRKAKGLK